MKNTFAPIFTKILDSSLWEEPYTVRLLFVTMLALKDADHVVRYNDYQLHRRANMKLEEVKEGLKILQNPDIRRGGQEFEGRRIKQVEDGWLILNGQEYEEQMRLISRRVYQARKQREYRDAKRVRSGPLPGENSHAMAEETGDQRAADNVVTGALPDKASPGLKGWDPKKVWKSIDQANEVENPIAVEPGEIPEV